MSSIPPQFTSDHLDGESHRLIRSFAKASAGSALFTLARRGAVPELPAFAALLTMPKAARSALRGCCEVARITKHGASQQARLRRSMIRDGMTREQLGKDRVPSVPLAGFIAFYSCVIEYLLGGTPRLQAEPSVDLKHLGEAATLGSQRGPFLPPPAPYDPLPSGDPLARVGNSRFARRCTQTKVYRTVRWLLHPYLMVIVAGRHDFEHRMTRRSRVDKDYPNVAWAIRWSALLGILFVALSLPVASADLWTAANLCMIGGGMVAFGGAVSSEGNAYGTRAISSLWWLSWSLLLYAAAPHPRTVLSTHIITRLPAALVAARLLLSVLAFHAREYFGSTPTANLPAPSRQLGSIVKAFKAGSAFKAAASLWLLLTCWTGLSWVLRATLAVASVVLSAWCVWPVRGPIDHDHYCEVCDDATCDGAHAAASA